MPKASKNKDPNMPKRAQSAYSIWMSANREKIKKPGMSVAEVAKAAGVEWSGMSTSEKSVWEQKAADDKERYEQEMAVYSAKSHSSGDGKAKSRSSGSGKAKSRSSGGGKAKSRSFGSGKAKSRSSPRNMSESGGGSVIRPVSRSSRSASRFGRQQQQADEGAQLHATEVLGVRVKERDPSGATGMEATAGERPRSRLSTLFKSADPTTSPATMASGAGGIEQKASELKETLTRPLSKTKMSSVGRRICLICHRDYPKNSLINHIAEHLNYKRHKCLDCTFESVLMEAMVDHQNNTSHKVAFDVKNWYLDRVCQMIYSDFEYAQKHGEDRIRRFGAAFGDKKRLKEMLNAGDIKEEGDEIEVIGTLGVEQLPATPATSIARPTVPTISANRRSFSDNDGGQEQELSNLTVVKSLLPRDPANTITKRTNKRTQNRAQANSNQFDTEPSIETENANARVQTAPADSSNEHTAQTTERILLELQRQITKGEDLRKCNLCHQMVENDYKTQKEHTIATHMKGIKLDENSGGGKLRWKLEQCFKKDGHLIITNDFQCNICGHETKYKDTRYHHVSMMHTDYQWECVFPTCDFIVRSKRHFNTHLNNFHELNLNQLEGEAKDRYIMMNSDFEHKLTPLVRKCFPFDLPNSNKMEEGTGVERKKRSRKGTAAKDENAIADTVVSNFMPRTEHVQFNRTLSEKRSKGDSPPKKMVNARLENNDSSDYTDSDQEEKPEAPKAKENKQQLIASVQPTQPMKSPTMSDVSPQQTPCTSSSSTMDKDIVLIGRGSYSVPPHVYRPRTRRMFGGWVGRRGRPRGAVAMGLPMRHPTPTPMKKQKMESPMASFRR